MNMFRVARYGFVFLVGLMNVTIVVHAGDIEDFRIAYQNHDEASQQGKYEAAIVYGREVLELGKKLKLSNEQIAVLTFNLGYVSRMAGHQQDARKILAQSVRLYETLYGKDGIEIVPVLEELALSKTGLETDTATDDMYRAVRITEKAHGRESIEAAIAYRKYADLLSRYRQHSKAKNFLKRATSIHEAQPNARPREYGLALFSLGKVQLTWKPKISIRTFNEALSVLETLLPEDHPMIASCHTFLIRAYEQAGTPDLATKHVEYLASIEPEDGDTEPVPLYRARQEFPAEALRYGIDAWAVVSFTIDSRGRTKDLKVIDSGTDHLPKGISSTFRSQYRRKALKAVKQYRFKPAIRNGEFVERPNQTIRLSWNVIH